MNRRDAMKFGLGSLVAALPVGPRAVAAIPAASGVSATTDLSCWLAVFDHEHHRNHYASFEITGDRAGFTVPAGDGVKHPLPSDFPTDAALRLCKAVLDLGS